MFASKTAASGQGVSLNNGYGEHVFRGAVADRFLKKEGMPAGTIEKGQWVKSMEQADKVARAVIAWGTSNGASVFCHWFQPMGASGVRHGLTAQVQNSIYAFDKQGRPVWDLSGKDLLQGETDGSSYPNGGLRATHRAGGYLAIDPTSPMFLRGDTIFIPACFVSYLGHSLDEKVPLLRSQDALSREGTRLFNLLGWTDCGGLHASIGLEQEFFLVPRDAYLKRPDLQLTGRTLIGKDAARGQEMSDHYMAPPSSSTAALDCMKEIQEQCYMMGIPLKTRHREVAPNQFEMCALFGAVTTQVDQNLMVMQIMEEVATKHGLACLLQEKPFNNVNGSGKHNNWSIWTNSGVNLMNPNAVEKACKNPEMFKIIMAAIVQAIDKHGDLMRMAIASPGNDFRLGACEAPPAIMTTYLGESMSNYLTGSGSSTGGVKDIELGIECMGSLKVPSEDRNRTSPFPYGGMRFEFRAVGSSQNTSLVNTVLMTLVAESFREFADEIEAAQRPAGEQALLFACDHAKAALAKHYRAVFNGNNYDPEMQKKLTTDGVWRIDSGVEAICRMTDPKNTKIFSQLKILSEEECGARQSVLLDHYVGTVEMEAKCLVDMINQHVLPSVKKADAGKALVSDLESSISMLQNGLKAMHAEEDEKKRASLARSLRLETMVKVRETCDKAENMVPAELWTLATYKDLLFLDQTTA